METSGFMNVIIFLPVFLLTTACLATTTTTTLLDAPDPFCVRGRLAPRILLIGTQKGGTTSLTTDILLNLPVSCGFTLPGEPRKLWKEKHFFDNGQCKFHHDACFANATTAATAANATAADSAVTDTRLPLRGRVRAMTRYLEHFPKCDSGEWSSSSRRIAEHNDNDIDNDGASSRSRTLGTSKEPGRNKAGNQGRVDQRIEAQPTDKPLPAGSATMDGTPRYLRMPVSRSLIAHLVVCPSRTSSLDTERHKPTD